MKKCNQCLKNLPLDRFTTNKNMADNLFPRCKDCQYEYQKEWKRLNPDKVRKNNRKSNLKYSFGLTEEDYLFLLKKQKGVCAICKNKDTSNRNLSVDHDHNTGRVRGLLCNNCNRALGFFKDNDKNLKNAIRYLRYKEIKGV